MTIREQAILMCAISASTRVTTWYVAQDMGLSEPAMWLADGAWAEAWRRSTSTGLDDYQVTRAERYAEAEAMLRTGWRP